MELIYKEAEPLLSSYSVASFFLMTIAPSSTLYIQNLPEKVSKKELKRTLYHLCEAYGQVIDVVALKTQKMKGQAFVVFRDIPQATNALRNIQNLIIYKKPINVSYAKTKSKATKELEKWVIQNMNEHPFIAHIAPAIVHQATRSNFRAQS